MSSYAASAGKAEQRTNFFSKRRNIRLCLLAFTIFYYADVCLRASGKYFWHDELITVYFARFTSLSRLWDALHSGLESNPPAFHLLTRASENIFGENLIGTRMPEIVAFWLLCLCLFYFVERRAGAAGGFVAMMLPVLTGAYYYAYEARPLILLAAFGGMALIFWDNAVGLGRPTTGRDRRWLIAFGLSLLAALMFHCYGVLLVIPFALVELYRIIRIKRWDWGVWSALTLPLIPAFFLYVAMLRFFRKAFRGTDFILFFPANWPAVLKVYSFLLTPTMAILLLFLALLAWDQKSKETGTDGERQSRFGWEDTLLCLGFAALPAFGIILGRIVHTPYFGRYFLSAILGFCIPFGVIAGTMRSSRRLLPILLLVIAATLLLDFGRLLRHRLTGTGESLEEPSIHKKLSTTPGEPLIYYPLIKQTSRNSEPIAVLDVTDFLYLLNYAPQLASRLYYVHPSARDQALRALSAFRTWSPVKYNPVLTGDQLTSRFSHFFIYSHIYNIEDFYQMSRLAKVQAFWATDEHFLAEMQTK